MPARKEPDVKPTVGQKLFSVVDATTVVVIRAPEEEVSITCGGREMSVEPSAQGPDAPTAEPGNGTLIGKRYEGAGVELLCVKGGGAPLAVNGTPVAQKIAKPLPASD